MISIIALLMAILMPALKRIKEQGKRMVCLSNLRQLTLAWILYVDDNNDEIVDGWTGHPNAWAGAVNREDSVEEQKRDLSKGALFPYCRNLRIYKCPTGRRGQALTYAVSSGMNGGHENIGPVEKKRTQIRSLGTRLVFVDEGRITPDSWVLFYREPRWWDVASLRHANGTNLSFADGHSEYWKWKDKHTVELAKEVGEGGARQEYDAGNEDLERLQRVMWGKLGYTP